MSKSLVRGLVASVVAAFAMVGLTACNSCCGCSAGPAVYKKPCCAGQAAPSACGCSKGATMAAPAPMPAPAAPAGGAKACGAGKCG
ncbi:MAG: hypothetical protein U1E39_12665 [Planctomycetota bacterium]